MEELTAAEVDHRTDTLLFKAEWLGRGYVDVRPGGKAVRDTINGVKIDCGRGCEVSDRVSSPARRDEAGLGHDGAPPTPGSRRRPPPHPYRGPPAFGARIDPYVRDKFEELWLASRHPDDDY